MLDTVDDDPLSVLQGHSITYRITLGPQAGRKVFTLQTLPPVDIDESHNGTVGQVAGFNLHACVAARAGQRRKLERLCRCYLATSSGLVYATQVKQVGARLGGNGISRSNKVESLYGANAPRYRV